MPRERVDFTHRTQPADAPEWMDEPCSYAEFCACLTDLAQVNRMSRGYRPVLRWLDRNFSHPKTSRPLRIADVGCGGGDLLRRIAEWAAANNIPVQLTGVDLNPYAVRAAVEWTPRELAISFVCGNALEGATGAEADIVVSSLMTHHLNDEEVIQFLAWMERTAKRGWFVNDLLRSREAASGFSVLARLMRWHRFVRHDGPVSFRRAFLEDDWARMLAGAGMDAAGIDAARIDAARIEAAGIDAARIERWFPGRLCVSRVKQSPMSRLRDI